MKPFASLLLLTAMFLPALSSCGGPRNFENENDRLRAENLELQTQVEELKARVENLDKALAAAQEQTPKPLPQGLHAPKPVKLELHRWTSAVDTDRDRQPDAIRAYAIPMDYQGRPVQVVGEAKVTLLALPTGKEPVTVQTTTLTPDQLNEAFRSGGLTGPHYTLQIPLENPLPNNTPKLMVRMSVMDTVTGRTLDAEQIIEWKL